MVYTIYSVFSSKVKKKKIEFLNKYSPVGFM